MARPNERFREIFQEISSVLDAVDPAGYDRALTQLLDAKRVFTAGAGRSGLLMQCFAMRLMHTGLTVHAAGEATTPAICPGDLLVLASGSGETASVAALARRAVSVGAKLLLITYSPASALASLAAQNGTSLVLPVPLDATRPGHVGGTQILGTLFDECVFFVSTLLAERVGAARKQTEADYARRHANLE